MTTVLAALVIGLSTPPVEFTPTDDIWVYPHASDPMKDGYLRVWGTNGDAVAQDPGQADEFSYSYLKFDLGKLAKGATIKTAKLVLIHTPDPTWALSDAKATPLEARVLAKDFSEKAWEYSLGKSVYPTVAKSTVFGSGFPEKIEQEKPVRFEIDLMKGPAKFGAGPDGFVRIALTSALDPSAIGNRAVYKFFSKDYDKAEYRPKLVVETN